MTREELLKVTKPILFNAEMVKAILDGRKTCTRRVVKYYGRTPTMDKRDKFYKINENLNGTNPNRLYAGFYNDNDVFNYKGQTMIDALYYPLYFKAGDILYVRETWQCLNPYSDKEYVYKASCDKDYASDIGNWLPSIHMPKEAARIFLKVTDVRVERLQDITICQLDKEGFSRGHAVDETWYDRGREDFIDLWNSTIKKQDLDKYGWDTNPFVWVIEFEKVEVE